LVLHQFISVGWSERYVWHSQFPFLGVRLVLTMHAQFYMTTMWYLSIVTTKTARVRLGLEVTPAFLKNDEAFKIIKEMMID
jgi:hypothetical protein